MAELAGIIESVKGAATIGVRLARTLYHAGHTAAPDDRIHAVAADVSFFALHLEQVAALLANPRSPHSPSALDSLTLVLNYAGALFQHFTTLVIHARDRAEAPAADASLGANGRRRRHSVAVRAKACFDEPFVAVLAAQLRHLTATVLTFIKTIQLASAVQGHAAPADLDLERSHLETLIVAQWLSINAMKDAHDLFESSRAPSTRTLPEIERATLQRHPALLSNLFAERIEPIWLCDASEDLLKRTFGTPKDDALALDQQPDNSIQLVDDILCKWTLVFDPNRSSDAPLESSAGTFAPDAASNAPQHVAEPGILSIPSIEEPRRRLETNEELGREGVESLSISAPRDVVYQSRGKASELHQPIPGRYGSNYRRPHVSSGSDSDEASDSDGAEPLSSKAERSQISSHGHHDSVIDEGLGIPWRLRISQTEYYDFRDEKLVGPRTPFLPREPRHWIYNHNNVTTEISQRWVSKDSIAEKQFTHVEIRPTAPGDEESWRIMRPLRFSEIEALVSRTIEVYRRRSAAPSPVQAFAQGIPERPPQPYAQPYARGQSYQSLLRPRQPSAQHRSVSFSEPGMPGPPRPARTSPQPPTSSPFLNKPAARGSASLGSSPQSRASAVAPQDYKDAGKNQRRDRDPPRDAWRNERGSSTARHDRDRDRDRDWEREASAARSGRHRQREARDRPKERRDDKRRSASGTIPVTLAKIGGLAALLEGLEGAF